MPSHKYIDRYVGKNGKYVYVYDDGRTSPNQLATNARARQASRNADRGSYAVNTESAVNSHRNAHNSRVRSAASQSTTRSNMNSYAREQQRNVENRNYENARNSAYKVTRSPYHKDLIGYSKNSGVISSTAATIDALNRRGRLSNKSQAGSEIEELRGFQKDGNRLYRRNKGYSSSIEVGTRGDVDKLKKTVDKKNEGSDSTEVNIRKMNKKTDPRKASANDNRESYKTANDNIRRNELQKRYEDAKDTYGISDQTFERLNNGFPTRRGAYSVKNITRDSANKNLYTEHDYVRSNKWNTAQSAPVARYKNDKDAELNMHRKKAKKVQEEANKRKRKKQRDLDARYEEARYHTVQRKRLV